MNQSTQQFKGYCPLPTHQGTKESFSVNFERNCWKCWAPSCSGGGVLDFVKTMEGCSLLEAAQKIAGWFGAKKQDPSLETRGLGQTQTNLESKDSSINLKPQLVKRHEPAKRRPVWAEKSRAESISDTAGAGRQPVPPNPNAIAAGVKAGKSGFMQEIDAWFDGLIRRGDESDADYWHRIRNGVKAKLIESFKNGQKGGKEVARTA